MANRAYLYSGDDQLEKLRDLSESSYPIPLVYKIILGCETELSKSKIWDYEHPIAIKGDFKKGMNRYYDFLDYLKTQSLDKVKIDSFRNESMDFFNKNPERKLDLFFLEAGEIYDLTGDIDPIEDQNKWLFDEINSISNDISEILTNKPENVFDAIDSAWLKELMTEIDKLAPYWTHVTYFSFNKSGKLV